MKNITLCILEREKLYGIRLAAYISDHRKSPFKVKLFLEHPAPGKELSESDLLLICSSLLDGYNGSLAENGFVVLDEDGRCTEASAVYKYQSAEKIYRYLIAYCLEKGDKKMNYVSSRDSELESEIILLPRCSENGYDLMAQRIVSMAKKKKLLYLNFRQIPYPAYEEESENFSELIYYLKQRSENMGARIEASVKRGVYDSIPPPQLISDLNDMSPDDWQFFLETIKRESTYQLLLFDFADSLPHYNLAMWVESIAIYSRGSRWEEDMSESIRVKLDRMAGEELTGKLKHKAL